MKIIIAGDGEVGFYLAKLLEQEYKDIVLVDTDREKLERAENALGIATLLGNCTSYKVLKEAGIQNADLFISVTSDESTNITACLIAKKLGAGYTIARINNMEYLIDKQTLNLKELGIDDLVSPESLACREIKHILRSPVMTETIAVEEGKLNIMSLHLDQGSTLTGKSIIETTGRLNNKSFMIVAINRSGNTIIPQGSTVFEKHDRVYFASINADNDRLLDFAGVSNYEVKKLLVIGGSRTGKYIAIKLSKLYKIKLIEKDLEKCNALAMSIPDVQIVNGDGTDIKLLQEERLLEYDAVVSVTGNSETNIFVCLIAKESGVKKTIAMVENTGLFDYSHKMGIDTLINKKLAASNFIFHSIRKEGAFSQLSGVDARIQEFTVKENAIITRKPIRELNFPKGVIIAGVIRNNMGFITLGDFRAKQGDRVYVFSLPQSSKDVNQFFC